MHIRSNQKKISQWTEGCKEFQHNSRTEAKQSEGKIYRHSESHENNSIWDRRPPPTITIPQRPSCPPENSPVNRIHSKFKFVLPWPVVHFSINSHNTFSRSFCSREPSWFLLRTRPPPAPGKQEISQVKSLAAPQSLANNTGRSQVPGLTTPSRFHRPPLVVVLCPKALAGFSILPVLSHGVRQLLLIRHHYQASDSFHLTLHKP